MEIRKHRRSKWKTEKLDGKLPNNRAKSREASTSGKIGKDCSIPDVRFGAVSKNWCATFMLKKN